MTKAINTIFYEKGSVRLSTVGKNKQEENLEELGAEDGLVDLGLDLLVSIGVSEIVVGDAKTEEMSAWGRGVTGGDGLKMG